MGMKKMVLGVALALLPTVGFTGLYEAEKITTVEQAKEQLLKRIESYWENPEEACHSSGRYRFKDATVDYPIEECLKDAGILFTQVKNEKEASEQAKIKRLEEAKQKEESNLAAKQAEQQTLEADLKSGKKVPENIKEALIAYGAENGAPLAVQPKIKPDGSLYGITGKIAIANDDDSFLAELTFWHTDRAVLRSLYPYDPSVAEPRYFGVKIPENIKSYYYENAKIGGSFEIIGRYTANQQYTTVDRETKTAPVFEVLYFKVI
jgi:hypothetical protein